MLHNIKQSLTICIIGDAMTMTSSGLPGQQESQFDITFQRDVPLTGDATKDTNMTNSFGTPVQPEVHSLDDVILGQPPSFLMP